MSPVTDLTRRRFIRRLACGAAALTLTWGAGSRRVLAGTDLTITIVFNNTPSDPRLTGRWGFGAWVAREGETLLFDCGGDAQILLGNMELLGLDPERIDTIALSHIHGDHTGGLPGLMSTGIKPRLCVPPSFPTSLKVSAAERAEVVEVTPGMELATGIFSTGEMPVPGAGFREQGLVVKTDEGLILLTGCAHPGIVAMVERVKERHEGPLLLVAGGFHLLQSSAAGVRRIAAELRELGVKKIAPSHCTGDDAIAVFAREFGDDFVDSGLGARISF